MSNIRQPLYGQAAARVRDQLRATALPAVPAQPGPVEGVDVVKLFAALPEVVDEAMRETLPDYYTPEKAAQLAEGAIVNLREMYAAKAAATSCGVR